MFGDKIRELRGFVIGALALFAITIVGLFQLAAAAIGWLTTSMEDPNAAAAIVGAGALLPLVVVLLAQGVGKAKKKAEEEAQAAGLAESSPDLPDGVRDILRTVQGLTRSAPFMAIAVAIIGGVVLVRYPRAIPMLMGLLAMEKIT